MMTAAAVMVSVFIWFALFPKSFGRQLGEVIFYCRQRIQELSGHDDDYLP